MENCVFNYFTNFETTEVSATQVRIGAGIGQLQGRYFCIEPNKTDNVTISNGTSGYRRTDTICAKITVNESEKTEAASWEVVKGTPEVVGPEWPAAPEIPQGELDSGSTEAYMAMYNVLIDGTSIYEIRPAYKTPSNNFELDPTGIINSGDDLDDYTDFGCWLCTGTAITNSLKNCPLTNQGFSLRVMRGTGSNYRVQEMIAGLGYRLYRYYTGTTWSAWKTDIGITKLWENASPGSAFVPQTIKYKNNMTLSTGDWIAVRYVAFTGQYNRQIVFANVGESFTMDNVTGSTGVYSGGYFATGRTGTANEKGITFAGSYQSSAGGVWTRRDADNISVPTAVYLIGNIPTT